MSGGAHTDTPGVLRTAVDGRFDLTLEPAPPALEPVVAALWAVEWDRGDLAPHHQATIPHPAVHVTVEADGAWVYGPPRRRFDRVLAGLGGVIGARFRPGAARVLLDRPVSALTDRRVPAGDVLAGLDGAGLRAAAGDPPEPGPGFAALVAALEPRVPDRLDEAAELAVTAVALLEAEPALRRAAELARHLGLSLRSLHRIFGEHVGVGPGWVARRFRLQEAAALAASGTPVD